MRRIITTQGPFQLMTALAVLLYEQDKDSETKHEDYLVLHGTCVGDSSEGIDRAMLDLARIWPWQKIIQLNEFERNLGRPPLDSKSKQICELRRIIDVAQADLILAIRNWQVTNELLLKAFPEARKVTYGDAIGQIDSYATKDYVQFDEGRFLLPFRAFSYSGDPVVRVEDLPYEIVPRIYFMRTIQKYLAISPAAREFGERLAKDAPRTIVVLLKNGAESSVIQLEQEVISYVNAVLKFVSVGDRILIKPHPRETCRQSQIVQSVLKKVFHLDSEILGDDTFLAYLPLEIFCLGNAFKIITSPLMSAATRHLKFLLDLNVDDGLNADLLKVLNPKRRVHHLATELINETILERLPSWDGKSVIYDWTGDGPGEQAIEASVAESGTFWPQLSKVNQSPIPELLDCLNTCSANKDMSGLKSALNEIIAAGPGDYSLLMDLGRIAEAIGEIEQAHRAYEIATIVECRKAEAHRCLAEMCRKLGQDLQGAVAADCALFAAE